MENRSHAVLAGLFVLVLGAAAFLAVGWFAGRHEAVNVFWIETRGNLPGLNIGAPVRYRGIRAGHVRDIRPAVDDPAVLVAEIVLDARFKPTDKTVARLNLQGVTGMSYVMLEESGPGGVALALEGATPPRLPLEPGLMQQLGLQAADIGSEVKALTRRLNRLLDEHAVAHLQRSIANLATASEGLRELPQLVAAMQNALSPHNLERLSRFLAHLEAAGREAAPLAAEARGLVDELNGLARRLDGLAETAGHLGERLEGETLPRAEALLHDLALATRRLDRFVESLDDTPQAVLFGRTPPRPGPGEAGFSPPRMP